MALLCLLTFRPDLTTIVVVDDVTAEQARRCGQGDTFGTWQATGATPSIDLPPVAPSKSSYTRSGAGQRFVAGPRNPGGDPYAPGLPTRIVTRLMLGNVIPRQWLYLAPVRDLRIRTGYVYSVGSDFDWSRSRADYSVSFGADTENVRESAPIEYLRDLEGHADLAR